MVSVSTSHAEQARVQLELKSRSMLRLWFQLARSRVEETLMQFLKITLLSHTAAEMDDGGEGGWMTGKLKLEDEMQEQQLHLILF